jgi:hypothetical protein
MPPAPSGQFQLTFSGETMRKLRQLSMAAVLAIMLAPAAFAGIIGTVPEPPPEPPPASAPQTIETSPNTEPGVLANDPVVDLVLDLMQSVLSLL